MESTSRAGTGPPAVPVEALDLFSRIGNTLEVFTESNNSLKREVENQADLIKKAITDIDATKGELTNLRMQLNDIAADVKSVKELSNKNESKIDGMPGKISDAEKEVTAKIVNSEKELSEKISDNKAAIEGLKSKSNINIVTTGVGFATLTYGVLNLSTLLGNTTRQLSAPPPAVIQQRTLSESKDVQSTPQQGQIKDNE